MTETKFSAEIFNAEIAIPGFNIFRQDRNFTLDRTKNQDDVSTGGGSIIYIRDTLHANIISSFDAPDSVAVHLSTTVGDIVIVCVYRTMSLNVAQDTALLNSLRKLCLANSSKEIFVVGDFNMPNVCWVTGTAPGSSNIVDEYLNVVTDSGLNWYITDEITRRRLVNGVLQESTLDQFFCTNDSLINDFKILSPIGNSDHMCILVEMDIDIVEKQDFINDSKQRWDKKK